MIYEKLVKRDAFFASIQNEERKERNINDVYQARKQKKVFLSWSKLMVYYF